MNESERRKYPRIDTGNLIACCCLDENENELDNCMVRALDVSPVGLKIESFQEIKSEMIRLIAVDLDGNLIDIKGRVVYSRKTEDGKYESGICLAGTELENTQFALQLIGVCHLAEPAFFMVKDSRDMERDRRKYPRVDTNNLISYNCLDENNHELNHCMARAVDINPLGAKIETFQEILSENIHLTSFDVDGKIIDIMGRVIHAHKTDDGKYEFGIRFMGTDEENTNFALRLIGVCHEVEPAIVMVRRGKR